MRTLETLGVVVSSRSDRDKIVYELKSLPDKLSAAFEALSETIKKPSKPLYMVGCLIREYYRGCCYSFCLFLSFSQISDAKTSVEARYEAFAASPFKELEEVN